jgi:hypothetical protein
MGATFRPAGSLRFILPLLGVIVSVACYGQSDIATESLENLPTLRDKEVLSFVGTVLSVQPYTAEIYPNKLDRFSKVAILRSESVFGSPEDTVVVLSHNTIWSEDGEILRQVNDNVWFCKGDRVLVIASSLPNSWKGAPNRESYFRAYGKALDAARTWFLKDDRAEGLSLYTSQASSLRRPHPNVITKSDYDDLVKNFIERKLSKVDVRFEEAKQTIVEFYERKR